MSTSPSNSDEVTVQHNVAEHRFEAVVDGFLSVAEYEWIGAGQGPGATVAFTHTLVPPELRGRGIAEKLVRSALAWAGEERLRVVPACSYVGAFIRRHQEFQPLVAP